MNRDHLKAPTHPRAEVRFPGIGARVIALCHPRADADKLLWRWVKHEHLSLEDFRRLRAVVAHIEEMGTLPDTA